MNVAIESLLFALLHPIKKDWLNIQVSSSFSITVSCIIVGTLQFRDTRKADSVGIVHCSTTTDVLCYVCSMQTPFMVRNTSEMSTKVKNQSLQQKWQGHDFRQQELCDQEQLPDRIEWRTPTATTPE